MTTVGEPQVLRYGKSPRQLSSGRLPVSRANIRVCTYGAAVTIGWIRLQPERLGFRIGSRPALRGLLRRAGFSCLGRQGSWSVIVAADAVAEGAEVVVDAPEVGAERFETFLR